MTITISIDCMGGDHGPSVTIPAAISFLKKQADVHLILVGLEDVVRAELKKHGAEAHSRLIVKNATEVVTMDDPLEIALRKKKDSSMRVAVELVKDGSANASVSAGNTGALMAVSRYVLKTMAGVDRPAICSIMPNQKGGPTYMLDLGANVDCEPHHLHQFAIMGSVLCSAMENIPRPTIGLLNVGTEEIKGNDVVKATGQLLKADHERGKLNFFGNVEGNDIFKGTVDVVVCDGFVGNVTLKAIEGVSRFFKSVFTENWLSMAGALLARKSLKKLNPERYNGASLLGLKGLVFKSHGGANAFAFEWALKRAYDAAKYDVQEQLSALIAELMPTPPDAQQRQA
ncbi:phosphate acyltransferase PlsX [Massilia sp. BSC265]|uniref:phosphate acyltransferase PlsX n=1 Tax=Massilia sp. BSC265 TaxID=1549812 RepID=UPI0004E93096|nr:phosphate acyltransferase PlsX [Massilia sp. BSC265]KFI08436.1 phosphate acyltransferase [Massilia sp. BSC265]KFI08983.1 phosphate acyltransferase [Massilia sp. BSC265]